MARRDRLSLPEDSKKLTKPALRRAFEPHDAPLILPGDAEGLSSLRGRSAIDQCDTPIKWLAGSFLLVIFVLLAELYSLQVVKRAEFYRCADRNFIRTEELTPDRGLIYDTNQHILAENRPVYDVYVTPQNMRYHLKRRDENAPDPIELLADLVHLTPEATQNLRERVNDATRRADILVARNISRDVLARVVAVKGQLLGTFIHTTQKRHYPLDEVASHLLGYMNEISPKELEQLASYGYHAGEYVGRSDLGRSFAVIFLCVPCLLHDVVVVLLTALILFVSTQLLDAI